MNLFLLDGTAHGRIKCTIASRSAIIFKIPRKDLARSKDRDELKWDGIYFLLGDEDDRPTIYIGQAGSRKTGKGIFNRLSEHDRNADKNFWTEAIILTTSDNTFGPTEISWLEHKFCDMAMKAARYHVKNSNDPSPGNITEEKESELDEQVEFAKLILGAIGYKIFEPQQKISAPLAAAPDEEIFYLKRNIKKLGRTIHAQMKHTSDGYVVLTGSEISPSYGDRFSVQMKKRRQSASITDGILRADEIFPSSSSAAEFVIGNNANGKSGWKTRDGVPLKNFLQGDD